MKFFVSSRLCVDVKAFHDIKPMTLDSDIKDSWNSSVYINCLTIHVLEASSSLLIQLLVFEIFPSDLTVIFYLLAQQMY